jgi:arylsulfatase A-like enzyme
MIKETHKILNRLLFITSFLILGNHLTLNANPQQQELPNIILLLGDDHGWDETGYNKHPYLKTPVLDEMASAGVQMNRFYSASAVCSPTRGSIITGRHPNRYGTFMPGFSIRPEETSIAYIMKKAGYATAHYGKWHLGPVKAGSPTNPGAMGFDEWLSHDNFFDMNPHLSRNGGAPEQFEGEGSEIIVKEALKFIQKAQQKKQPFFVVIWYGSPHEPYAALPQDLALYDDLPDSFGNKMVTLTSNETGLQIQRLQRDVLRERFAEITAMDRSIGQVREFLQKEDLRNNTILWYFGDNGTPPEANATVSFREEKASIYEGGVRVPCVMEWPSRIKAHKISEVNMVSSDVFPTLSAIVGQPLPDRPLDGINILPMIEGKTKQRPVPIKFWIGSPRVQKGINPKPYIDPALQEGTTPMLKIMDGKYTRSFKNFHHPDIQPQDYRGPRAILDNRYKLVIQESASGELVKELYDMRTDPGEKTNVISSHPEIAKNLEIKLHDWQQSVLESLTGKDYQ